MCIAKRKERLCEIQVLFELFELNVNVEFVKL